MWQTEMLGLFFGALWRSGFTKDFRWVPYVYSMPCIWNRRCVMVSGFLQTLVEILNKVVACVADRSMNRGRLSEEEVSLKAASCGFLSPAVRLFYPECPPPLAQVLLLASIWLKGALETARLSRPIWSCKTEQRGRGPSEWTERSREGKWRRDRALHSSLPPLFAISPLPPPPLSPAAPFLSLAHVHRRRTHPEQHKERSGQSTSYLLPRNAKSPICSRDERKGGGTKCIM